MDTITYQLTASNGDAIGDYDNLTDMVDGNRADIIHNTLPSHLSMADKASGDDEDDANIHDYYADALDKMDQAGVEDIVIINQAGEARIEPGFVTQYDDDNHVAKLCAYASSLDF